MDYTIIIVIVTSVISIGAVASSIPFLEFSGPISESGGWKYKLINRGSNEV
ncbi:MAG: hypothetical protein ACREV6_12145 [Clostridium sp.]|uniref:hypothetical protein n=1 Tax=Clostridium sp. TaxID=1506 RepID=UPI003D6CDFFB